jgi:peroxiredoxin
LLLPFVAGLVVAVSIVAIVFILKRNSLDPTATGPPVDPALSAAAKAVHFHSTMNASVGKIEDMPVNEATPEEYPDLLPVGSVAPDFALKTPTGEQIRFSDYRGRTVLLEFLATWCPRCQAETKHLISIVGGLPSSSVAILAINADGEDAASTFAFDRYFGIPFPTLLDPSSRPGTFNRRGEPGAVSATYKAQHFPTFYIVNSKGMIVWRSVGEQPDALLEREIATSKK